MKPSFAAAGIAAACIRLFRRWVDRLREHARHERQRRALADLDDETFRDIGIDRSEVSSCWAEHVRRAEPTRLRVASGHALQAKP